MKYWWISWLSLMIVSCSAVPTSNSAPPPAAMPTTATHTAPLAPDPSLSPNLGEASIRTMDQPPELPILSPAPELTNDAWLNSDRPLRLSELRGKVVLIDMWTFG